MTYTSPSALDLANAFAFGVTKRGQPLSYNRAPAADLAAWIARVSVTKLILDCGQPITCGLFADTSGIRIQLAGNFVAETRQGTRRFGRGAVFCGPQSRLMPVRVEDDFISIALSFRPSACPALVPEPMADLIDQVRDTEVWSPEMLVSLFDPEGTPEEWLQVAEGLFRSWIAIYAGPGPNPVSAAFEEIAFINPAQSIAEAARAIGVDRRRLERTVVRDFGMPPKQVLKRARALDMASHLRGVADGDEAEALALRYYDESHLIREFIELFGMSPRQFAARPQPLLTVNLEIRQARRLEMIRRLEPGARRPWQ